MASRLPTPLGLLLVLPVLGGCTQTAAPAMPPTPAASAEIAEPGSGVLAAIADAKRTEGRHRMTSAGLNLATSFDPTGLSGYAVGAVEEAQQQIEDEKYRRIDEEVEKAIAEGLALQAQNENPESQGTEERRRKDARRKPAH
ncbi:hypothetical protein [Microvirga arabica]|uniref:DUF4398 domain-containing protein n=1 Tax=Microvirga arabica TaxID=1128671 RepID=A0ABV6YFL3_9HYPH|nr:hypothetical protein [Microvirga arabica]MBM1170888.1 hypothetical protein [Microvirga arabica]